MAAAGQDKADSRALASQEREDGAAWAAQGGGCCLIGGTGRCGTTLVVDLLGCHSQVAPLYETDFVTNIAGLIQQRGFAADNTADIRDPPAKALYLASSFDDFKQPACMGWNGQHFELCVQVAGDGETSFQLLLDGSWEARIYPSVPDAHLLLLHQSIRGPSAEGNGRDWVIGRHKLDAAKAGDQFKVMVTVDSAGMPTNVSWRKEGRLHPLEQLSKDVRGIIRDFAKDCDTLEWDRDKGKHERYHCGPMYWGKDPKHFKNFLFRHEKDFEVDISNGLTPLQAFTNLLQTVLGYHAKQEGKRFVANKTPSYADLLPILLRALPSARAVCLVRDAGDVTSSFMSSPFGPDNVEEAVAWINGRVEHARGAEPGRCMEVSFEHLVESPDRELRRLQSFLGLKDEAQEILQLKGTQWSYGPQQLLIDRSRIRAGKRLKSHDLSYLEKHLPEEFKRAEVSPLAGVCQTDDAATLAKATDSRQPESAAAPENAAEVSPPAGVTQTGAASRPTKATDSRQSGRAAAPDNAAEVSPPTGVTQTGAASRPAQATDSRQSGVAAAPDNAAEVSPLARVTQTESASTPAKVTDSRKPGRAAAPDSAAEAGPPAGVSQTGAAATPAKATDSRQPVLAAVSPPAGVSQTGAAATPGKVTDSRHPGLAAAPDNVAAVDANTETPVYEGAAKTGPTSTRKVQAAQVKAKVLQEVVATEDAATKTQQKTGTTRIPAAGGPYAEATPDPGKPSSYYISGSWSDYRVEEMVRCSEKRFSFQCFTGDFKIFSDQNREEVLIPSQGTATKGGVAQKFQEREKDTWGMDWVIEGGVSDSWEVELDLSKDDPFVTWTPLKKRQAVYCKIKDGRGNYLVLNRETPGGHFDMDEWEWIVPPFCMVKDDLHQEWLLDPQDNKAVHISAESMYLGVWKEDGPDDFCFLTEDDWPGSWSRRWEPLRSEKNVYFMRASFNSLCFARFEDETEKDVFYLSKEPRPSNWEAWKFIDIRPA